MIEPHLLLGLEAAHADQRHVARFDHPGGEAVERVVVLAEQPRERHAVEAPGMAGARRMRIHVGVDPHQPEVALDGTCHARPGAAGAAMVAAEHAGQAPALQRIGPRRGEQTAELAPRELPAPLGARGREDRARAQRHAAALQLADDERRQHRRRLGATGLGTAESPSRADQFDLSLHIYAVVDALLHEVPERAIGAKCPRIGAWWRGVEKAMQARAAAARSEIRRWQDRGSFALGLWLAVSPWFADYAAHDVATANAAVCGLALALTAHF